MRAGDGQFTRRASAGALGLIGEVVEQAVLLVSRE